MVFAHQHFCVWLTTSYLILQIMIFSNNLANRNINFQMYTTYGLKVSHVATIHTTTLGTQSKGTTQKEERGSTYRKLHSYVDKP